MMISKRDRNRKGVAVVEFAVTAPLLVIIVFGGIEHFDAHTNGELRTAFQELLGEFAIRLAD